jgi:modulator of FtsH protease HflK
MSADHDVRDIEEEQYLEFGDVMRIVGRRLRWTSRISRPGSKSVVLLIVFAVAVWLLSGIYKVQPDEQGVVLRFGKWIETTAPGMHYRLPYPIDFVMFPKVTAINQVKLGEPAAPMALPGVSTESERQLAAVSTENLNNLIGLDEHQALTGDENIVKVDCVVLWQIKDAREFLFRVYDPEEKVRLAAESALREVIGQTPIQASLSEKRREIADQTRDLVQQWLDAEHAGIVVRQIQLQRIDPPSAVFDAFNDVQRARADQERARNEAEAYAGDIIPRARGEADRMIQDAEAYKARTVNVAEGEAKSFQAMYESYAKAEEVTAWRLYVESIDEVLRKANRVIIDSSGKGVSGLVPYLPLPDLKPAAGADQKAKLGAPGQEQGMMR